MGSFSAQLGQISFRYYLKEFERLAKLRGWSDETKMENLPLLFDRYAAARYEQGPVDTNTYAAFKTSLLTLFDTLTCRQHHARLLEFLIKKGESILDYSERVLNHAMGSLTRTATDAQIQELAVSKFWLGIAKRVPIEFLGDAPDTLDKARQTAMNYTDTLTLAAACNPESSASSSKTLTNNMVAQGSAANSDVLLAEVMDKLPQMFKHQLQDEEVRSAIVNSMDQAQRFSRAPRQSYYSNGGQNWQSRSRFRGSFNYNNNRSNFRGGNFGRGSNFNQRNDRFDNRNFNNQRGNFRGNWRGNWREQSGRPFRGRYNQNFNSNNHFNNNNNNNQNYRSNYQNNQQRYSNYARLTSNSNLANMQPFGPINDYHIFSCIYCGDANHSKSQCQLYHANRAPMTDNSTKAQQGSSGSNFTRNNTLYASAQTPSKAVVNTI